MFSFVKNMNWYKFTSWRVPFKSMKYAYPGCCMLGTGIAAWILNNQTDFHVPTMDEVNEGLEKKYNSSSKSNNQVFTTMAYNDLISTFLMKWNEPKAREINEWIDILVDEIDVRDKIVVDVGSGLGLFTVALSHAIGNRNGCYVGLDICPSFVYYLENEVKDEKCSNIKLGMSTAQSLCLPSELRLEIDTFFLSAVFHHLDDRQQTLKEMFEYLKPGGQLIIIEFKKHVHEELSEKQVWIASHIDFTEEEAIHEITESGFVLERCILKNQFIDYFAHVYRKPNFM